MLGGLRTVLTVWMDGVQWGGNRLEGEEHAEIDRGHIVQDLRIDHTGGDAQVWLRLM